MRILKLLAKILHYLSDELNKICENIVLYVSIQIAERISTGTSDMAIVHSCLRLLRLNSENAISANNKGVKLNKHHCFRSNPSVYN